MTGWRALLRLAARDARRDRWRTLLVVVMIALPVAGLAAAIGIADTATATAEERVRDSHGRADLRLVQNDPDVPPDVDALLAALPPGAQLQVQRAFSDSLSVDGELRSVGVGDDAPVPGSLLEPRHRLTSGALPSGPGEVAVSESMAERHHLDVGDRLRLEKLGDVEVVGVVRRVEALWWDGLLAAPGTLPDAGALVDAVYVGVPAGRLDAAEHAAATLLTSDGSAAYWVTSRTEALSFRMTEDRRFVATIAGGLAAVEAALIAGAAFAVSVRRRQRELGLLAAVGGSPRQVRQAVRLTGLTAGIVGSLVGLALAVVVVLALTGSSLLETLVSREIAGPRLDPWWLAGVAAIGVLSAVVGAWWPARTVARLPIMAALSGRRPTTAPPRRTLAAGLAFIAFGIGVLVAAVVLGARVPIEWMRGPVPYLVGSVALVLGVGLLSPWLLERLAAVAPSLPLGPRLAVRDAARFRTRNGPIVTAAMAGLAATVTVTAVLGSLDRQGEIGYRPSLSPEQVVVHGPDAARVATSLAEATGGRAGAFTSVDLDVVFTDGDGANVWAAAAAATPEAAGAMAGADAADALRTGAAVVVGHAATAVGLVPFGSWTGDAPEPVLELPARSFPLRDGVTTMTSSLPTVLLPVDALETLHENGGFDPPVDVERSTSYVVAMPGPVDEAAAASARSLAQAATDTSVQIEEGYVSTYRAAILAATVGGALVGLVLVAVAVALASAEARADARTLAAVGASRRTRRSLAGGRAALLSGVAGVLAVPVGLIPAAALLTRMRLTGVGLAVPWVPIAVVAVVVPLVALAGAWAAATREPAPAVRAPG